MPVGHRVPSAWRDAFLARTATTNLDALGSVILPP